MANRRRRVMEDNSDFSSSDEMASNVNISTGQPTNMFANDGSFLEMFKKRMEQMQSTGSESTQCVVDAPIPSNSGAANNNNVQQEVDVKNNFDDSNSLYESQNQQQKKTTLQSFVGKRRGGKVLPTGMVKKVRKDGEEKGTKKEMQLTESRTDAWSQYMAEVRKYKERSCEDEGKTRPLVK